MRHRAADGQRIKNLARCPCECGGRVRHFEFGLKKFAGERTVTAGDKPVKIIVTNTLNDRKQQKKKRENVRLLGRRPPTP